MYGNVVRVKILFNKKDNALLQMSDIQQSETAMNYLKVRGLKHQARNEPLFDFLRC